MVELPQGDVTEVRRGGPESLRLLSTDMARLGTSGYIRIERRPKEQMPRIGHIAFLEGKPMFALHEADAISMSLEALLDIENDAALLDALLAIHELPSLEITNMLSLYSEAQFQMDDANEKSEHEHQWWSKTNIRTSKWRREERLPELEVVIEAPEAIRQRSKALLQRHDGLEKMLRPGDAYFFDSQNPAPMFDLAGHLAVHGRPLFVLARHDIEALNVQHNIPIASSSWLSQNGDARSTNPALETIRRRIDSFLWENLRAVVVLEGIEYLASLHGDDKVVNFLRDIVDGVRLEDHLFLATGDFNAFPLTTREHVSRYMSILEPSILEHWNLEPDLILDHPLCAPPSEEEAKWIEQQLQQAISIQNHENMSSQATVFGTMEGGVESPDSDEIVAATETLETVAREWNEPNQIQTDEVVSDDNEVALPTELPSEPVNEVKQEEPLENEHNTEPENDVSEVQIPAKKQENIEIESNEASVNRPLQTPKKPSAPRPAQRIRRRKKKSSGRKTIHNQQAIQAAASHAVEVKELLEIETVRNAPRATFSNSLESYALRQDQALENMRTLSSPQSDSSLNNSTIQFKDIQDLQPQNLASKKVSIESVKGRRPVHTETNLTPLSARPGAEKSSESKTVTRESASRVQSQPSIEEKLSIWEIEDRERLKKELEGDKK
tara:strand:+ start:17863 stop:19869 length:2007 start_codon:yes stop_codon:yes gene_type:complete